MKLILLSKPTKWWWNKKSIVNVLTNNIVLLMYTTNRLVLFIFNDTHSIIKIWTVLDKCTSFFKKYFTCYTLYGIYMIVKVSLSLYIKLLKHNTLLISLSLHLAIIIRVIYFYLLPKGATTAQSTSFLVSLWWLQANKG